MKEGRSQPATREGVEEAHKPLPVKREPSGDPKSDVAKLKSEGSDLILDGQSAVASSENESEVSDGEKDVADTPVSKDNHKFSRQRRLSSITSGLQSGLKHRMSTSGERPASIAESSKPEEHAKVIDIPLSSEKKRRRAQNNFSKGSVLKRENHAISKISETGTPEADETASHKAKNIESEETQVLGEEVNGPEEEEERGEKKSKLAKSGEIIVSTLSEIGKMRNRSGEKFENYKINDEIFIMKDLCKPNFILGKTSENFDTATKAQLNLKLKRSERRKARERARRERKPVESLLKDDEEKEKKEREQKAKELLEKEPEPASESGALQVTLKDGKMTLDVDSQFVHRGGKPEPRSGDAVDENPFENPVNSHTYGRNKYTDRWQLEETLQLYRSLSLWGTDFGVISQIFPYRNRRQIKLKYNLEERKNPEMIDLALNRKLPIDFSHFCKMSGRVFKTLDEYNEELRELKTKHEAELRAIRESQEKSRVEDLEKQRLREIEIQTGAKPRTKKEQILELRKHEEVVGTIDSRRSEALV